jgi:hypothetical protein
MSSFAAAHIGLFTRAPGPVEERLYSADAPPNLSADRARALAASTSRSCGSAVVTSESMRTLATSAIPSTARSNAASFAWEGFVKPDSFLTNWSEASRISASVAGGSKLKRVLMFLHMGSPRRSSQCNAISIDFVLSDPFTFRATPFTLRP